MKKINFFSIILKLGKLFFAKTTPAPPALEEMVRHRLDAIHLRDKNAYRITILQESLAQIDAGETRLFDWQLERDFKRNIPVDFKVGVIALDQNSEAFLDEFLDYPVKPTHLAKISFKESPNADTTLFLQVIERGGRWFEVAPIPDPSANRSMAEATHESVSNEQEAHDLYFRLDPGFYCEVAKYNL